MPTDLTLDDNHDIDISAGTLTVISSNPVAVAQRVKVALLTKQGEWFADTNQGVPYYQAYFTRKSNKEFVDSSMVSYIAALEGVTRVISYDSEIDVATRNLAVEVSILAESGEIVTVTFDTSEV